jgi:hypothetical protein
MRELGRGAIAVVRGLLPVARGELGRGAIAVVR